MGYERALSRPRQLLEREHRESAGQGGLPPGRHKRSGKAGSCKGGVTPCAAGRAAQLTRASDPSEARLGQGRPKWPRRRRARRRDGPSGALPGAAPRRGRRPQRAQRGRARREPRPPLPSHTWPAQLRAASRRVRSRAGRPGSLAQLQDAAGHPHLPGLHKRTQQQQQDASAQALHQAHAAVVEAARFSARSARQMARCRRAQSSRAQCSLRAGGKAD